MRILILGRESLINELLCHYLKDAGFEVAAAENNLVALEYVRHDPPDIVIIDAKETNGARPATLIKSEFPQQKIVVLSNLEAKEDVMAILRLGVEGYILKTSPPGDIYEDLIAVNEGERRVSRKLFGTLLAAWQDEQHRKNGAEANSLTMREYEVLGLVAEGQTNKEIGRLLSISPNTVKYHISSIMDKLGAKSRTDAVFKSDYLKRKRT